MKAKYWLKDKLYEVPSGTQHGEYAQDNFGCADEFDAIDKGYARIRFDDNIFLCDFNESTFKYKRELIDFIKNLPNTVDKICLNIMGETDDYKEFDSSNILGISSFINSSVRRNNMIRRRFDYENLITNAYSGKALKEVFEYLGLDFTGWEHVSFKLDDEVDLDDFVSHYDTLPVRKYRGKIKSVSMAPSNHPIIRGFKVLEQVYGVEMDDYRYKVYNVTYIDDTKEILVYDGDEGNLYRVKMMELPVLY